MKLECPLCDKEYDTSLYAFGCPKCFHNNTMKKGGIKQMKTFKEEAKAYEPKRTLNIADLDRFDISTPLENREGTGQDGKAFKYKVAVIDEVEYRVPNTVLEETQKLLAVKDDIKFIKVNKNGTGITTKYTVSVLD